MAAGVKFAQGDILIERVFVSVDHRMKAVVEPDPDGVVVLGRGERSGHRHAVHGNANLYRLVNPGHQQTRMPDELYVGHLVVRDRKGAVVRHEEHAPIALRPGTYRIRRQRVFTARQARVELVRD